MSEIKINEYFSFILIDILYEFTFHIPSLNFSIEKFFTTFFFLITFYLTSFFRDIFNKSRIINPGDPFEKLFFFLLIKKKNHLLKYYFSFYIPIFENWKIFFWYIRNSFPYKKTTSRYNIQFSSCLVSLVWYEVSGNCFSFIHFFFPIFIFMKSYTDEISFPSFVVTLFSFYFSMVWHIIILQSWNVYLMMEMRNGEERNCLF